MAIPCNGLNKCGGAVERQTNGWTAVTLTAIPAVHGNIPAFIAACSVRAHATGHAICNNNFVPVDIHTNFCVQIFAPVFQGLSLHRLTLMQKCFCTSCNYSPDGFALLNQCLIYAACK